MKKIVIILLLVACITIQMPRVTQAAELKDSRAVQIQTLQEMIDMLQAKLDVLKEGAVAESEETISADSLSVRSTDHTRGSLDAPIILIEYTDLECPFCKMFHGSLEKVYKKYGPSGDVLIVQRHFPLTALHPNAGKLAVAGECVAHLKDNDAYWKFIDSIFTKRKSNELTNMKKVSGYAADAGVNKAKFTKCLKKNTYQEIVDASIAEGYELGVSGTPMTFLVKGDQIAEINGTYPFEIVDEMIRKKL